MVGKVTGDVHAAKGAPSRRHSNVAPASLSNASVALGTATTAPSAGPAESVVSGAVPSTVKPREAGVASTLPASSRARTSTRRAPSAKSSQRVRRAAAGPRPAVQPALEGHASGRAERQRHVRADGRALGGASGDRRVGRHGVDGPGAGLRRRVGRPRPEGAHREGVLAVGQAGIGPRRGAGGERRPVELALVARRTDGGERERRVGLGAQRAVERPGADGGVRGDRRHAERQEAAERRGAVVVAAGLQVVRLPRDGAEAQPGAQVAGLRVDVVAAGDERQRSQGRAAVHGEHGVEVAAERCRRRRSRSSSA